MVDTGFDIFSTTIGEKPEPDPYADGASPLTDIPKAFGARGLGMVGDLGAVVRSLGESRDDPDYKAGQAVEYLGELTQKLFGGMEEATIDSMSETSKRDLQATFTDPNFWSLNSFAMKAANMAPDVVAAVVPSVLFPGLATAVGVAAAQGGAFSAAAVVDDFYKMTDELTDVDLQRQSPYYQQLRADGIDEEAARAAFNEQLRGARPLIVGAIGAITNVFGPAGQAARIAGGAGADVAGSVGRRVAGGAAEGAIAEGIQEGAQEYFTQEGAAETGLQEEIDPWAVFEAAGTGAVMGGVFGGGIGAVGGERKSTRADGNVNAPPPEATPAPVAPPSSATSSATPGVPSTTPATTTPSASGQSATPGVSDTTVAATSAVDVPAPSTTMTVVEGAGGDPAQTVALQNTGAPAAQATPELPTVSVAPVGEPAAGAMGGDVAPAAPVTTEGNRQVQQAATEPVPLDPALEPPQTPEASPSPAVAEPAPIQQEATPAQTGPRILTDLTAPDYAAENAEIVRRNIRQMEEPVEGPRRGRNRTAAEIAERTAMRDGATLLAQKYPPREEEAGLLSKRPKDSTAARRLIIDRAKAISDEANAMGLKLPKAWRDNAKDDQGYNPETLLVMEARRLASIPNPKRADYERFLTREMDIRSGAFEAAVSDRRAEGDMAARGYTDVSDMADRTVDTGTLNPEEALIAAEEMEPDTEAATARGPEDVPESIDRAMDEALYTTPKADRRTPVVEARKRRTPAKPAQPVSAQTDNSITAAKKLKEIKDRLAAARDTPKVVDITEARRAKIASDVKDDFAERARNAKEAKDASDRAIAKAEEAQKQLRDVQEKVDRDSAQQAERTAARLDEIKKGNAEFAARVAKARADTNTNPTQDQALAGNYKKGRVSLHGHTIAIENPKGSIRSNKDPNGPKWKVKLPADYGYLVGSRGADGDPVDVYVGPTLDATYVYVIDQVDPNTRVFDEHKVMMGFKSEQAAINTYDKAYSDGMGMLRVGDLRKMTYAEFKEWLAKDPKDRSGLSAADEAEIRNFMFEDEFDAFMVEAERDGLGEGVIQDPVTNERAVPISTRKAKDLLAEVDLEGMNLLPRMIARMARNQLMKTVGNVDVHFVSAADINRMSGYNGRTAPQGYHIDRGGVELVVINADVMNDPARLRHVLLHEVTHAATVKAIVNNAKMQDVIYDMIRVVNENTTLDNLNATDYATTNPKEFIAEAFSNPAFQEELAKMEAPPHVVMALRAERPILSMWDAFVEAVRRMLGMPGNTMSLLEAAIRTTEVTMRPRAAAVDTGASFLIDGNLEPLKQSMRESLRAVTERPTLAPTNGNPQLLGFRTFDHIARAADRYFGKRNNPVRKIADLVERQRTLAQKYVNETTPTIQKLYDLQTKYRGRQWEEFTSLVYDETMTGVFADRPLADQKHITKNGSRDSWQRKQHPELARRYAALPEDLKAARKEAMDYFRNMQNDMSLKLIRNRIVTLFDNVPDPEALATRIHEGTVTDADKALMGEAYDAIAAAGALSKIDGPYFPLMRRGNYVVKGRYRVTPPGNARKVSDNEFEFTDKDAAASFAESQTGRPTIRTVYVDKVTGETTGTENGKTVRLTAQDFNAEPRYRVVVQDRHMEMFDTMREARQHVAEMRAKGYEMDDAVPRSFDNFGMQTDALSAQMRRLVTVLERKAEARGLTDSQKADMMSAMNEVSLAMLGSTRIQSRNLPRTYVAGASKDLVRNIADYNHASSNYRAKLDTRLQLDAAMSEMEDAIKESPKDGWSAGRVAIRNEVVRRVATANPITEHTVWNALTSRILSMSFVDKLMSPSYSVINATQPWMISAPYLAGRYGIGKTYAALGRAYNDIGSMQAIREGFADTLSKMKPGNTIVPTDPVSLIRERLKSPVEKAFIDAMIERGSIDTDAGLEVSKLIQDSRGIGGKLDKGIGYLEGIARQMPKTVEAINRTTVGLAAFRLEMDRSGDVARATQFAQDTINLTQFNYSASNAAPYMNHPALRLMLQFKKYGVGMYQFMGEQAAIAWHNAEPGDRSQALKSLSYTIGMHVLVAGAMGLPTEPIKLIVTAANGLGITDWSWADIEIAQREAMADLFGQQFGEIVSRGIPRAAGIDLSSRMGIDTLMGPFGEPRSNEAQDWKAYMWDMVSGAPAGLVADWAKGINDLAEGDVVRAMERLVPVKAFADSIKAYRTMTEGTVSERSGRQVMSPYTVGEAITRGLGFQPAREAESFERSNMFYKGRDKQEAQRKEFQREWVEANGAARGRIWREITKWNKSQPREVRLSLSDLRTYQKRLKADMRETKEGIRARRREQHLMQRADETFNYLP